MKNQLIKEALKPEGKGDPVSKAQSSGRYHRKKGNDH
jgi:hypothetical protein